MCRVRIIAGQFRGRKLLGPQGDTTRPITDRVKQSLFDILTPLLEGARVLDLFAGTGSLGLEALSRGAAHVTFHESDCSALALLYKNIRALGVEDRTTIVGHDIFSHLGRHPEAASEGVDSRFALAFLDPPYRFVRERPDNLQALVRVLTSDFLADDATVVFRHDASDRLDLPPLVADDVRNYGGMTIQLLRKATRP
jgi:16S rRNA (guanine966-N2)-methyltransferase